MPISKDGLITTKFGALFTAAELTNPIATIKTFTLTGTVPVGWTHWGHLSRENLPETSSEGGDTTMLSTWLEMNTDSETEETVDSIVYSMVQQDAATIDGLAQINGTRKAALELWVSGAKRFAVWYPSVSATVSGRPSPNGTDQYAESKLKLTVLAPPASLNLASLADPEDGIAAWPTTTKPDSLYFDNTAFAA